VAEAASLDCIAMTQTVTTEKNTVGWIMSWCVFVLKFQVLSELL